MQGNFSEPEKQGSLYSALKLYRKNGLTAINTPFGAYNNIRGCELLSKRLAAVDNNSDTSIWNFDTVFFQLHTSIWF